MWHYDALGRLVAREKVSGTGGAADVRMYFDGEHDIEVVQWDGSAESHRKTRVYGERIDELLEYTDISADPDEVYYAHTDLLGSVQVMVDDTGAIAESYRYSDWGETRVVDGSFAKLGSLGSNIGNFIRYTGRERAIMATVGDDWYFYRARMYRPDAGRFGQRELLRYSSRPLKSDPQWSSKGSSMPPVSIKNCSDNQEVNIEGVLDSIGPIASDDPCIVISCECTNMPKAKDSDLPLCGSTTPSAALHWEDHGLGASAYNASGDKCTIICLVNVPDGSYCAPVTGCSGSGSGKPFGTILAHELGHATDECQEWETGGAIDEFKNQVKLWTNHKQLINSLPPPAGWASPGSPPSLDEIKDKCAKKFAKEHTPCQ